MYVESNINHNNKENIYPIMSTLILRDSFRCVQDQ